MHRMPWSSLLAGRDDSNICKDTFCGITRTTAKRPGYMTNALEVCPLVVSSESKLFGGFDGDQHARHNLCVCVSTSS